MGRQRKAWLLALVVFVTACAGFWALSAWRDREASISEAADRTKTTAILLQEHAARAIEFGDSVLKDLVAMAGEWDLRDPVVGRAIFERLRGVAGDRPQLSSAWLLDADGRSVLDSWSFPARAVDASSRSYFRLHRDGAEGLIIGAADTGSVSGRLRFTLSRPIFGPGGEFRGVAVAGIDSAYFREVYQQAALGPDSSIRLFTRTGHLLAAWPEGDSPDESVLAALRAAVQREDSGLLVPLDDAGRITAFRKLRAYPMVVSAGMSMEDALAGWRRRTFWSAVIAAAAIAGFAMLVAMGLGALRREAAARRLLESTNEELEERFGRRTRELEALYRDSPVGLALFSSDMRFLRVNDRLAEINGRTVDEHIGRPIREVVPALAEEAEPYLRRVLETREPVAHVELRGETPKAPGLERVWLEDFYPVKSAQGNVWAIGAIVREVTDQVRAQEALRSSEARYRALTEAIASVVWTTPPDGQVIDMAGWRALTGQTTEQVAGWGWTDAIHPDDRAQTRETWQKAVDARAPYDTEYRVRSRDGKYGWYNARAIPVVDEDGSVREWVGVCIDITARKQGEERQTLLMAELDHRVRNILASIQSMVTLTGAQEGSRQDLADALRGRIAAMARTLSLLTLSRWDGASLEQIVRDELLPYDGENRIDLAYDRDHMLKPKQALSFALVVHELATNAAKYGSLSVAGGALRVDWRQIDGAGDLRLRMTWQESGGPSVEPPSRRGFGSILIEKTLETEADAFVNLVFAPDGVRCVIELPLERVGAAAVPRRRRDPPKRKPTPDPGALPRTRVLVAEDEMLVALSLEQAMADAGLEVVGPAATLDKAWELADAGEPIGAAVLDTNLHGEMVYPLAEALAARRVPVLLVTGYGNVELLPAALRALPRLQKPVSDRDLVDRLRDLIKAGEPPAAAVAGVSAGVAPEPEHRMDDQGGDDDGAADERLGVGHFVQGHPHP